METSKKGLFIVVDGMDGAGKGAQIELLKAHLESMGRHIVMTREPGGTDMAQEIRNLILTRREEKVSMNTDAYLFMAAREQNIENVIKPALERGDIVICDRWDSSTWAYQSSGNREREDRFVRLKALQSEVTPDIMIILDVDLDVSKERRRLRGEAVDRMEAQGDTLFKRVQVGMREYVKRFPEGNPILVDSNQSLEDVSKAIISHIMALDYFNLESKKTAKKTDIEMNSMLTM